MDSRGALIRAMPGNSERRGRRSTAKKGATIGTGGKNRAGLQGRGRTLPADERPWHKGYSGDEELPAKTARKQDKERRAAAAQGRAPEGRHAGHQVDHPRWRCPYRRSRWRGRLGTRGDTRPGRGSPPAGRRRRRGRPPSCVVGRNPVLEALRTHTPCTALYVALGIDIDERVTEIVRTATDRGVPLLEVSRAELDRMTGGVLHQGIGLQVPPFSYEPFEDLLASAREAVAPLLVALDGVTDPRNLGAVVRSAAAFGAQGVFLPERRAAGMTATAWRTSAGAAARLPVAQVTNLTRSLQRAGMPASSWPDSTPTAAPTSTTSRPPSGRWWSWSAPRVAGCPASSAPPATSGSASRFYPLWTR